MTTYYIQNSKIEEKSQVGVQKSLNKVERW